MAIWSQLSTYLADQFGAALIVLCVLSALELMFPAGRQSVGGRVAGLAFWIIYLPVATLAMNGFGMMWQALGVRPLAVLHLDTDWAGPLAVLIGPVVGALVYDFFFYWYHRAQHRWFWRFHAVHHSIRELNTVNSYHHLSEVVFQSAGLMLPASLFLVDGGLGAPVVVVLIRFHASFIHSSTRLHLGPLRLFLCDNRFHRIHHSLEERHFDRNFGAFTTLWDRVFGTAHFPEPDEWPATGLEGVAQPETVGAWLALPMTIGRPAAPAHGAIPTAAAHGQI
ncbi:sterol desaturase family protein [Sphingomonas sp.]|uniref:sterol desaturase family protein n=1 Tax=Sphingomonas sp. TaxID=28214 RepID=UPI001E0F75CE|nr:sterol desaturase family protein [Sphingomonas sp.]MBX9795684.1 sterol desaturase family protein [Sphingomonas sp.]